MHPITPPQNDVRQFALCTVYIQDRKIIADGLFSFTYHDDVLKKAECLMIEENPIQLDDIADANQIALFDDMVANKEFSHQFIATEKIMTFITHNAATVTEQYLDH